jgi:hypothetical protein
MTPWGGGGWRQRDLPATTFQNAALAALSLTPAHRTELRIQALKSNSPHSVTAESIPPREWNEGDNLDSVAHPRCQGGGISDLVTTAAFKTRCPRCATKPTRIRLP